MNEYIFGYKIGSNYNWWLSIKRLTVKVIYLLSELSIETTTLYENVGVVIVSILFHGCSISKKHGPFSGVLIRGKNFPALVSLTILQLI